MASSPLLTVAKITLATSGFTVEPEGRTGRVSRSHSTCSSSLHTAALQPNFKNSPPPRRKWLVNSRSVSCDDIDDPALANENGAEIESKFSLSASYYQCHSVSEPSSPLQKKKKSVGPDYPLHCAKTPESVRECLATGIDPNLKDAIGNAAIHVFLKKQKKDCYSIILTLLIHSSVDVNIPDAADNTPLHLAVMNGDEQLVQLLIVFGANVNSISAENMTPLDIAIKQWSNSSSPLLFLLPSIGALPASAYSTLPRPHQLGLFGDTPLSEDASQRPAVIGPATTEPPRKPGPFTLCRDMEAYISTQLETMGSFSCNTDEAIAVAWQQKELLKYKRLHDSHVKSITEFDVTNGSRVLSLDGGGMKGLIQIEVLSRLEESTGRKVTELFDWIIATSTGAIVALGLVYGKLSLGQLRQLYFKFKEDVFSNERLGFAYNTEALEKLIKDVFGTETRMGSVTFPRVLIAAVNKSTTQPELHFFNNCFQDQYSDELVWKVARYTSAAPMYFTECDNYVDGGVLANNPSEYGLTAIQNYYRHQHKKFSIALMVSVGSGIYPSKKLGKVDAQEYLFFGKHWLKFGSELKKRAQNLITLLTTALLESELVAENSRSRLREQRVPFYRFSPELNEVIAAGETDTIKLVDMVMKSKFEIDSKPTMSELIQVLYLIAELTERQGREEERRQKSFIKTS